MANRVKLRSGSTVPVSGDLEYNELGIAENTYGDTTLYIGTTDSSGDPSIEQLTRIPTQQGNTILLSTSWNSTTKIYSLNIPNSFPTSIIHVGLNTPTDTEAKAWSAANVVVEEQRLNTVILRAVGSIPTINLPIFYTVGE